MLPVIASRATLDIAGDDSVMVVDTMLSSSSAAVASAATHHVAIAPSVSVPASGKAAMMEAMPTAASYAPSGGQPNDRQRHSTLHDHHFVSISGATAIDAEEEEKLASSALADECADVVADAEALQQMERNQRRSADYVFAWSVATQKGYRYEDAQVRGRKFDIHPEMEDFHFPSNSNSPNFTHRISGRPFQVFMLADGHGGHACAKHAIKSIPEDLIEIMHSRDWDLHAESDRRELTAAIEQLFQDADDAYCQQKLEQFHHWIESSVPFDPRDRTRRPSDDGCTLVANVLYQGFLINCNVGDSRTLLMRRSSLPESVWEPCFASLDHTPGHPVKARHIHANGGRFIYNGATAVVDGIIENVRHSEPADTQHELARCRIGRQIGWKIEELDFPASTTLNLTGTMGDLFFKYAPALISAKPDVSYYQLEFGADQMSSFEYMMVMASDGLWDHMAHSDPFVQHSMVAGYAHSTMEYADVDRFGFHVPEADVPSNPSDPASPTSSHDRRVDSIHESDIHRKLQKLGMMAHGLCDREMVMCNSQLFARGYARYDDVTAFVVLVQAANSAGSDAGAENVQ